MSPRTPASRVLALFIGLCVGLVGIAARLAILQVGQAEALQRRAAEQRVRVVDLPALRGAILDRNREPLALSVDARDVYADPRYVDDPRAAADAIAPILGVDPDDLATRLSAADSSFVYVARQVPLAIAEDVEALGLRGIGFIPTTRRTYPAGALAPQVLGFVGIDGVGLAGLEYQHQDLLAGVPGSRMLEVAPGGSPIAGGVDVGDPAVPGSVLVTTLDRDLQYRAQVALAEAVQRHGARGGMVVVMDPRTGDVLAMATAPDFDPNDIGDVDADRQRNRAVTDAFEPGSTAKLITMAAALESGLVDLDEVFSVRDRLRVGDFVIHDAYPHPERRMTVTDIVAESSNVGTAEIARRIGAERLRDYLARFGLGQRTGIDFPGESGGIMLPERDWNEVSLVTISYGLGIGASLMQMLGVYATIANGGERVPPRLIRGTVDPDGTFHPSATPNSTRVISAATAATLTGMLVAAVDDGTGELAALPGYQVAGKTGTARIPYADRPGYHDDQFMASFIGFLPAGDPELLVGVVLDRPATAYGGVSAAPLFRAIAAYAVSRWGVQPAEPVLVPPRVQPAA